VAFDLNVDLVQGDPFAGCDRSDRQGDSGAQRCGDQFNGAGRVTRFVVAAVHLQLPVSDAHLGASIHILYPHRVAHGNSTFSQSSAVTPGVSALPLV